MGKTCIVCGRGYDLICVPCFNKKREEILIGEMEKVGLTLPYVIKKLAEKVEEGSFQSLSKAINLLVIPTTRVEVTGSEGGPIEIAESKSRIADICARIAARVAEEKDNPGTEPGGPEGGADGTGGDV